MAAADELSIWDKITEPLTVWTRPERFAEPRIWHRENGVVVRDVTPDFDPFVVQHMTQFFLKDEPMNQASRADLDPIAVAEFQAIWLGLILPQRMSIVALEEGSPGADLKEVSAENPPIILGVNQLNICTKNDPPMPDFATLLQSEKLKVNIGAFYTCGKLVNIFERYNVDLYMDGAGMSVAPPWRGKGIGQMLVKGRKNMCKEMGIPVTKTVFTAIQSQKVALKGGFELLGEVAYADMKGPDGLPLFPDMHPEHVKIQLMAMRIE